MDMDTWKYTRIDNIHPEIIKQKVKKDYVVLSCAIDEENWWLATVDEIIGKYNGLQFKFNPKSNFNEKSGNFKGYGDIEAETMEITVPKSDVIKFYYETGKASMAPIYYLRFWRFRYPVIAKLKR